MRCSCTHVPIFGNRSDSPGSAVGPGAKDDKAAVQGTGTGALGPDDGSESQRGALMATGTQRDFSCLVLNVCGIRDLLIPSIFSPLE